MRFDTAIRNSTVVRPQARALAFTSALIFIVLAAPGVITLAQQASQSSEPPEMLVTEQGFLAIDTPKGWVRADRPGLAYFLPKPERTGKPRVWIYISSAPAGPAQHSEDVKAYTE